MLFNKKIKITFCFILIFLRFFSQDSLVKYVNPFIGTGGHGHTFPGAVLPFGMVQLSPDTRIDGSWDGCGGYHYSDSIIYGFSHTHLSGTGVSDWGDVMLMPSASGSTFDNSKYSSRYHKDEKASAGYYEVLLHDKKIKAELTATLRTGIHRYNFPATSEPSVILELLHRDKLLSGTMKIIDSCTIIGYRTSEAWAREQHCYFAIRFSKSILKTQFVKNNKTVLKPDTAGKNQADQGIFFFAPGTSSLLVKVALSPVSMKGALNNLDSEAPHWDFESYKKEAALAWEKQLKKIVIKDKDKNKLTVFYTALYHCFIHPSLNMDYDHRYRGRDNQIHTAKNFTNYTVFSLWDTYRALHPLFTIVERKKTADFINTFLEQYRESKRLPMWELSGNETNCMIGYHAASVIADAMCKRISGFDSSLVLEAVKSAANYTAFGIPAYIKKGFLSADDEPESVSKTLEYAYDDWCIAQILKRAGKKEDYVTFLKRAQSYKNVFDPATGFMRPRKNGNWLSPFDPREVNNYFTEGNSWQYSFYVPHDLSTLINMHGSDQIFERKLDSLFNTNSKTTGRTQDDITGLIGQYAQGNEPSHHMAYLYNYVGKPYKTQDKVEQIINEFYGNSPDGLIGNEDCGQMSAWYVFSALGFYPVCPGSPDYIIGKPLFDTARIHLEDGKILTIIKHSSSPGSKYIYGASLNNKPYNRSLLTNFHIINGGTISFSLQPKVDSSSKFCKGVLNRPLSKISSVSIIPAPLIVSESKSFEDSQRVEIKTLSGKTDSILFTLDGTEPTRNSTLYKGAFSIDKSCTIKARVFSKDSSKTTEARFYKKPNNWKITLKSKYNRQYTAGGDDGIIDGIYGDDNWRKGEWQGYQYQDFEATVDLTKIQDINSVSVNCLQDTRSWIIFPTQVEIFLSTDNQTYTSIEPVKNSISPQDYNVQVHTFKKQFTTRKARYVKIIARNFGTLPAWHEGKGDGAFIFIDEIEIK